jgi:hypothetical protein
MLSDSEDDSDYEPESESDGETEKRDAKRQKGEQLSLPERWHSIALLCGHQGTDKKLPYGALTTVAEKFSSDRSTMSKLWKNYSDQLAEGIVPPDLDSKAWQRGRKSKLIPAVERALRAVLKKNKDLPVRSIVSKLFMDHNIVRGNATIHRYLKELGVKVVNSFIKPSLTVKQKIDRLEFVLGKLQAEDPDSEFRYFYAEWKTLHADEKWFYVIRMHKKIRLFPGEGRPDDDQCRHKTHIPKIMFLAVVGTPHRMPNGQWFDGKIGMWPFATVVPAARASKHRPAGTPEIKSFNVGAQEYFDAIVKDGGVLAAVREKMTGYRDDTITIQHDGASPHTGKGNPEALDHAGAGGGGKIGFEVQPAQSPDVNKLDLSLFYSMQAQSHKLRDDSHSLFDLRDAVMKAYNDYPEATLERVEATRFVVYREILKNGGGNQYDMPHTGITNRQNNGGEVADRRVSVELVESAKRALAHLRTLV